MIDKILKIWPDWTVIPTPLGQGGGGTVYKIQRELSGGYIEEAAVKVVSIPKDHSEIEEFYSKGYDSASISTRYKTYLNDIEQEYQLMNSLKGHTNIVYCDRIETVQHEDGIGWDLFIKMELLTPLSKIMDLGEKDVVKLGGDICAALLLCNKRNIIHRDIKPSNIMRSKDGDYKLGDFGVARTAEESKMTMRVGTRNFMAPEIFKGEMYNASIDIYSLGMVMYWMLNKRTGPFLPLPPVISLPSQEEEASALRLRGTDLPAPVSGSSELQKIVLKACAFRPEDRYASAAEMLHDLNSLDENALGTLPLSCETTEKIDKEDRTHGMFDSPPSKKESKDSSDITDGIFRDRKPTTQNNDTSNNGEGENDKVDDKEEVKEENAQPQQQNIPQATEKKRSKLYIPVLAAVVVIAVIIGGIISGSDDGSSNTGNLPPVNNNPPSTTEDAQSGDKEDTPSQNEPEDTSDSLPQELVWSEWTDTLPDFVYDDSYIVESKLQYRQAPRYDFFGSESLTEEYTVCYTSYGEWGEEWSGWSTTKVASSDLIQVETGTRYWYQNYVMWPTVTWGVYERRATDKTYSNNVLLKESDTRERLHGWEQTIYRYKSRLKIYFCVKDSEWCEFRDEMIPASSGTVVNTRTLYRYAKKLGNEEMMPSINNFPSIAQPIASRFADISDNSWYGANKGNWVGIAVDLRVMSANEYQQFRPEETLTIAELVKTAVAVRKLYNGDSTAVSTSTQPWYGAYVDYAIEMNIIDRGLFSDYTKPATRAEAALILSRILPVEEYGKRNTVRAITDVGMESKAFDSIWRLAESGVISWPNPEGAFDPDRNITRVEVAAMISRIVYPELRA